MIIPGRSTVSFLPVLLIILSQLVTASSLTGTLLLSEVMGDPSCSEYYAEFLELYCSGPDSVDLHGWCISVDGESDQLLCPGGYCGLAPGQRALVLDAGYNGNSDCYEEIIPDSVLRLTIDDAAFGQSGIPNSRGVLIELIDSAGNPSCRLDYPACGPPGHSFECITIAGSEPYHWDWSLDEQGTPGWRNSLEPDSCQIGWTLMEGAPVQLNLFNNGLLPLSQLTAELAAVYGQQVVATVTLERTLLLPGDTMFWQPALELQGGWVELQLSLEASGWRDTLRSELLWPGECWLRFNEIMPDPGGRGPEWLELINAHPWLSMNLRGLLLEDNCSDNPKVMTPDCLIIQPGEMLVITGDAAAMTAVWGVLELLEMEGVPRLGNNSDCLVLLHPDSSRMEELQWDTDWICEPGYSLERYNPELPNGRDSWSRCLDAEGGTPAAANSIRLEQLPTDGSHSCSGDLLTPDGDGIDELLVITLRVASPHQQFRVRVFNLAGICVRCLDGGSHGAAVTRLYWDGRDDAGRLLPPGVYIVLAESAASGSSHPVTSKHAVALYY